MKLSLIVAATENLGIGYQGKIPWLLRKEMAYFAKMTTMTSDDEKQNAVIMGRKTWESIPEKFRPLRRRVNIVLSRSSENNYPANVILCNSFQEALKVLQKPPHAQNIEKVWVIGGSSVYQEALKNDLCHRIYVTWIKKDFECDTFFSPIPDKFFETRDDNVPSEMQEENGINYEYKVYEKKNSLIS